jgi:1-acyl-sn-glycerol-3-phosphate acyltransferase
MRLCTTLLEKLHRIWLVIFPEGTRTPDGQIRHFKRGVSIFSLRTNTPILFLFLENAYELWPKGRPFTKPGKITVHIGPVHPPAKIDEINRAYYEWASTIKPEAFQLFRSELDQPKPETNPLSES